MTDIIELAIDVSEKYDFTRESLQRIENNAWVRNQWPLVYFIENSEDKIAYVGESAQAGSRIRSHLTNPERLKLKKISIIGSEKFNKSATLDIESNLIQYLSAEGTFKLQNNNLGQITHNYYQKDLYNNLFRIVWSKLLEKKIITKSLAEIENTQLFKYSPFKTLNKDQHNSVLEILEGLSQKLSNTIFISGSAGTGKTIMATYLMKLLTSNIEQDTLKDMNDIELNELNHLLKFKAQYPNTKIGLVVAMSSLRETLKNVFRQIPGLRPSMVISPSDVVNSRDKYDLLLVDEAHRLRQFKNISWMGIFRKNNQRLGLSDAGTELDWIMKKSHNQIFFYDPAQSVKPSDVKEKDFIPLLNDRNTLKLELKSQMRVLCGNDYIDFVDKLMNQKLLPGDKFQDERYELVVFDSLSELYSGLAKKEKDFGLSRMVAGFAWPWISKSDNTKIDIEIEDLKFQWNQTDIDWVNSPNAFREVGCIHTIQGYDLNYTGIIFGKEILYNPKTNLIEIDPKNYFDIYGKKGVSNLDELKAYIINIYKTLLYRGIRGTYIYVQDPGLREYFKQHITASKRKTIVKQRGPIQTHLMKKMVPFFDISIAAGKFSEDQISTNGLTFELPEEIQYSSDYFVCRVVGESMNKIIPNGAYCLFRKYDGGSRNGKIVLVQCTKIQEADFGSGYTVKKYQSEKIATESGWVHKTINLIPMTSESRYTPIILTGEALEDFKVVGVFEQVLL